MNGPAERRAIASHRGRVVASLPAAWLEGATALCARDEDGGGYIRLRGPGIPDGDRTFRFDYEQDGAEITPSVVRATDPDGLGLEWFAEVRPPFEAAASVAAFGRSSRVTELESLETPAAGSPAKYVPAVLRLDCLRALADAAAPCRTAADVAARCGCLVEEAAFGIADLVGAGLAAEAGVDRDGVAVWEATGPGLDILGSIDG